MHSKKSDIKKKQIANWNKQQSPRVKPIEKAIEQVKADRKMKQALENIEFRRHTPLRDQLIAEGTIKPTEEK